MSASKASVSASIASESQKLDHESSGAAASSQHASLASAASAASASAAKQSSNFFATAQTAVTVTSSSSASPKATAGDNDNKSPSNTGVIVGASIGGAVGAIVIVALILWRFCRRRDHQADTDDIRWPELKADHDMTGAAMQPVPTRKTGGAGFDMGEDDDAELEEEEEANAAHHAAAAAAGGAVGAGAGAGAAAMATHPYEHDDYVSERSTDKYGAQNPAYGVPSSTALNGTEGYSPEYGPDDYQHDYNPHGYGPQEYATSQPQPQPQPQEGYFDGHQGTQLSRDVSMGTSYGQAGMGAGQQNGGGAQPYYETAASGDPYYNHTAMGHYPEYGAPIAETQQTSAQPGLPASLAPGSGMYSGFNQYTYPAADQGFGDPYGRTH